MAVGAIPITVAASEARAAHEAVLSTLHALLTLTAVCERVTRVGFDGTDMHTAVHANQDIHREITAKQDDYLLFVIYIDY